MTTITISDSGSNLTLPGNIDTIMGGTGADVITIGTQLTNTNNTPQTVDNNQLIGQIWLKPTRTAEFIALDFNILPTSATIG